MITQFSKMNGYIDINSKGVTLNSRYKVEQLIKDGATEVKKPQWQDNLVCVIQNPTFDVAVHCYTEEIFNSLKKADSPFVTWLIHPHAKIMSGCKE